MSGHKRSRGNPKWIVTFADLMSLLLTLFVMMLTFSQLDLQKYRELAGSMKDAFGVQYLVRLAGFIEQGGGPAGIALKNQTPKLVDDLEADDIVGEHEKNREAATSPDELAASVKQVMAEQISRATANVEVREGEVIVRFPGRFAFPSGGESLTFEFLVALKNLIPVLEAAEGEVVVAGHTDDRPISTERFRSNWDLSTARANSVVHYMLRHSAIDSSRLAVMGYADSRPLAANDGPEGRARNRRVEIIIRKTAPPGR